MPICTRFGTEVEITDYNANTGDITVRLPDGEENTRAIYELKADGGIKEIEEAIKDTM